MDCEKFDQHVLDALYDELDELTRAALERHMAGCARCAQAYAGLKATREVAVLPLEEPSDDLERRILDAAILAQRKTPIGKRVVRALAWAGSHAMRREFAMAAVAVLVLGSSLLLLRARPGTMASAPVGVREYGAPAPEADEAKAVAAAAPAATAAATAPGGAMAYATPPPAAAEPPSAGADGPFPERAKAGAKDKAEGKADAPTDDARAALAAARDARSRGGCAAAVGPLGDVAARFPGTAAAADAMWDAAACYRSMGQTDRARELYLSLRQTGAYRDRADHELASFDAQPNMQNQASNAVAGRAAAAAQQRSLAGAPGGGAAAAAAAPAAAPAAPARVAAPQKAADQRDVDGDRGGPTGPLKAAAPARKAAPAEAAGF
jgi:hypothetical protein